MQGSHSAQGGDCSPGCTRESADLSGPAAREQSSRLVGLPLYQLGDYQAVSQLESGATPTSTKMADADIGLEAAGPTSQQKPGSAPHDADLLSPAIEMPAFSGFEVAAADQSCRRSQGLCTSQAEHREMGVATDATLSAAATAHLLLALGNKSPPKVQAQLPEVSTLRTLPPFEQQSMHLQQQQSPTQQISSAFRLPAAAHRGNTDPVQRSSKLNSVRTHASGSEEASETPVAVPVNSLRAVHVQQQQPYPWPVPLRSTQQMPSSEAVTSPSGKGFRAYVSPQSQQGCAKKARSTSLGTSAADVLRQSSSRISSFTNALASGHLTEPLVRAATASSIGNTLNGSEAPSISPSKGLQISGTATNSTALDRDNLGGSSEELIAAKAEQLSGSRRDIQGMQCSASMPVSDSKLAKRGGSMHLPAWSPGGMAGCMEDAGMQPFWTTSRAEANANEQAEMAAFCVAYQQTANAARDVGGGSGPSSQTSVDMQHQHMMLAMHNHAMFQQHMMMQHLMMSGLFPGARPPSNQSAGFQPPPWMPPGFPLALPPFPYANTPVVPGVVGPQSHDSGALSQDKQGLAEIQGTEGSDEQPGNVPEIEASTKQDRRTMALRKYKMKRQNLCFTKKIRYESRKQLAKARPRVKGQFVRLDSADVSEGDFGELCDGAQQSQAAACLPAGQHHTCSAPLLQPEHQRMVMQALNDQARHGVVDGQQRILAAQ